MVGVFVVVCFVLLLLFLLFLVVVVVPVLGPKAPPRLVRVRHTHHHHTHCHPPCFWTLDSTVVDIENVHYCMAYQLNGEPGGASPCVIPRSQLHIGTKVFSSDTEGLGRRSTLIQDACSAMLPICPNSKTLHYKEYSQRAHRPRTCTLPVPQQQAIL